MIDLGIPIRSNSETFFLKITISSQKKFAPSLLMMFSLLGVNSVPSEQVQVGGPFLPHGRFPVLKFQSMLAYFLLKCPKQTLSRA